MRLSFPHVLVVIGSLRPKGWGVLGYLTNSPHELPMMIPSDSKAATCIGGRLRSSDSQEADQLTVRLGVISTLTPGLANSMTANSNANSQGQIKALDWHLRSFPGHS